MNTLTPETWIHKERHNEIAVQAKNYTKIENKAEFLSGIARINVNNCN